MLPLILIDGSSFLYRAYYAAKKGFTTSTGLPTGAVLIMSNMLQSLLERFEDSQFLVVFDAKGRSFRADLYPAYKANRPPMPEDLIIQLDYVRQLVQALGFPMVIEPGVEADDVLGSYAKQAEARGRRVVICTGDKDLAQLVTDNITLYDGMKEQFLDRTAVKEKYGVVPELIIDFLALKGDTSDNIPGMSKVGDKTACELLNNLGGINAIEAHLDEVKNLKFRGSAKFAERFKAELETIRLSYRLATIKTDLQLPIALDDLKRPQPQHERLVELYRLLEFKRLFKEELEILGVDRVQGILRASPSAKLFGANLLMGVVPEVKSGSAGSAAAAETKGAGAGEGSAAGSGASASASASASAAATGAGAGSAGAEADPDGYQDFDSCGLQAVLIDTEEKLQQAVAEIKKCGICALDTETDSLQAQTCRLVGISLSPRPGLGYYIPVGHNYLTCPPQLPLEIVKKHLGPLLQNAGIRKFGHNLKFDLLVLKFAAGLEVQGIYCDSMLAAHLINSIQRVSLDDLASSYLHYKTITYEEITGGSRSVAFSQVPVEDACRYSAEDAEVSLRLGQKLLQELQEQGPEMEELFFKHEMPFLQVLFAMECNGAYVSARELNLQNSKLNEELAVCQRDIFTAAGKSFNISSPKQLGQVLFSDLKIPYPRTAKLGKGGVYSYSTAEEVLREIAPAYDIANLVLRYRELSKLISTYTEKLPQLICPNGRIYTSFNQAGTVTGRLSSSDPNLQNIPARTEEGKRVRRAFCAPEDWLILSADYSQIELRLIAHISREPNLIQAFLKGQDIHRATAAEVMGKAIEDVTPAERSHAKATNFGLMYGMSAHGLAKQTGMGYRAAQDYINRYFERYPQVRAYMQQVKEEAHRQGYVTTISGRRINFAAINAPDKRQQASAERAAINAPMQGSAADIIKEAMLRVHAWIASLPPEQIRLTLQVHDELVFEVREDFAEGAAAKIKEMMESAAVLAVPLEVGIGIGRNWADAH